MKLLISRHYAIHPSTFTLSHFEYNYNPFTGGYAITGGFVYRGNAYPHLYGYYTTIDYVTGNAWALHKRWYGRMAGGYAWFSG